MEETKTHDDVINEEIEQEHAEVAKENAEAAECSPWYVRLNLLKMMKL